MNDTNDTKGPDTREPTAAEPSDGADAPHVIDQRSIRNILVKPGLQLRYAFYVGAIASACACALSFGFLVLTLSLLSEPGLFMNIAKAVETFEHIRWWGFGLVALTGLLSLTSFIVGLRLSHRLAGPLRRLDKYLELLLAGNYSERVSLRESDEFRDIADKLNVLADRLEACADPSASLEVTKV